MDDRFDEVERPQRVRPRDVDDGGVGDNDSEKKGRGKQRAIETIPFVGLGFGQRDVSTRSWFLEEIPELMAHAPVWWKRVDLLKDPSSNGLEPAHAPFGDEKFLEWMLDCNLQAEFAERFHIPLHFSQDCKFRVLKSDKTFDATTYDDLTSRVLFNAIATNPATELDCPLVHEFVNTTIPQFHNDIWSVHELRGECGGLAGTDVSILWNLSVTDDLTSSPRHFLATASGICQALTSSISKGSPYWPGINTKYTRMDMEPRSMNIKGVQYITNGQECTYGVHCKRPLSYDCDDEMLQNIMEYRKIPSGEAERAIRARHKGVIPDGSPMAEDKQNTFTNSDHELFDCHFHVDVYKGIDENGQEVTIKLDCIRIKSRVPGVDTAVAIKQWLQNSNTPKNLTTSFFETMQHMCFLMNGDSQITDQTLFSTSGDHSRHFSSLSTEANLPFAVAHLAAEHRITDVCIGGMRIDYNDPDDNRIYRNYLMFLWNARINHFCLVMKHVMEDLGIGGLTTYAKHAVSEFPLVGNCQVVYRSIRLSVFKSVWMKQVWDRVCRLMNFETFVKVLGDMLIPNAYDSQFSIGEDEWAKIMDGTMTYDLDNDPLVMLPFAGPANNSGIYMRINLKKVQDEMHLCLERSKRKNEVVLTANFELVQPHRSSPACEMFLQIAGEKENPFFCFIQTEDGEGKAVLDPQAIISSRASLSAHTLKLQCLLENAIASNTLRKTSSKLKEEDILRQYGRMPCPAIESQISVMKRVDLEQVARSNYSAFQSAMRSCIDLMFNGDLMQHSKAAVSYAELKRQGILHSNVFKEQLSAFNDRARIYGAERDLGSFSCDGNLVSCFRQYSKMSINLDIFWLNNILMEGITNTQIAMFIFQPKFWGATIWISNTGQATEILEEKQGHWKTTTRMPATVTIKDPSMGADAINQTIGLLNSAYPQELSTNGDINYHYNHDSSKDEISLWNSALAMSQKWGSGIMKTGCSIDTEGAYFREQFGLGGCITELMKTNASSEKARDAIGDIEPLLAESGGANGMKKNAWTSTHNFTNKQVVSLFHLPLYLICSNRPLRAVPTSTQKGGRMQIWQTTEADKNCGVFESKKRTVVESSQKQKNLGSMEWNDEGRNEIKELTRDKIRSNRLYFLCLHLCRCFVPYLHRCLRSPFVDQTQSLCMSFKTILQNSNRLTLNVRRSYLMDSTTFSRTFFGCYRTSTATPQFVKEVVFSRMMQSVMGSERDCNGKININLQKGVNDSMLALHTCPISTHSLLSSLYIWISQTILDVNVMIITNYMLYVCNFRNHCPLHVIAMAVKGVKMNSREKHLYTNLCEYLVKIVLQPQSSPAQMNSTNSPDTPRLAVVESLVSANFRHPPSYYYEESTTQENLRHEKFAIDFGNKSTYVRSDMVMYDANPDWFSDAKRTGEHNEKMEDETEEVTVDKYVRGSNITKIAHSFATQHSAKNQEIRKQNFEVKEHHRVVDFFNAASKGTKLPRPDQMQGRDQQFESKFENVELTSYWWMTTINNLSGATGPVRQFLTMCGFSSTVSRREILEKILANYLDENKHISRQIFKTPQWNSPVLSFSEGTPHVHEPAFRFGFQPFQNPRDRKFHGLETFIGIDILWLIVGQGLFTSDWKSTIAKKRKNNPCNQQFSQYDMDPDEGQGSDLHEDNKKIITEYVVHNRNMASATRSLLELALHTMICKSVVPVQPISLPIPQSDLVSAKESSSCVVLRYVPELHTDSSIENANLVSINKRHSSHYDIIVTGVRKFCQIRALSGMKIYSTGVENHVIVPYLPEGIAHVVNFSETFLQAITKLSEEHQNCIPTIALAMRMYGSNIQPEMVSYYGSSLTEAVTEKNFELPCMTYHNGFMFCLCVVEFQKSTGSRKEKIFKVLPVKPTHSWYGDKLDSYEVYTQLPLQSNHKSSPNTYIPLCDMARAMHSGLTWSENGGDIYYTKTTKNEERRVPFFPMPLLFPNQLVLVRHERNVIPVSNGDTTISLREVNLRENFEKSQAYMNDSTSIVFSNWMRNYPDLPPLHHETDELFIVTWNGVWAEQTTQDCPSEYGNDIEGRDECTRFWITNSQNTEKMLYFNSTAHLISFLKSNPEIGTDQCGSDKMYSLDGTKPTGMEDAYMYQFLEDDIDLVDFSFSCNTKRFQIFTMKNKIDKAIEEKSKMVTRFLSLDAQEDRDELQLVIDNLKNSIENLKTLIDKNIQDLLGVEIEAAHQPFTRLSDTPIKEYGPPATFNSMENKNEFVFGFIEKQNNSSSTHNGNYLVRCEDDENQSITTPFDFISIQRCVVPEGTALFIILTEKLFAELSSLALMDKYELENAMGFEENVCILQVFYVYGLHDSNNGSGLVRVLVPVLCYDDAGIHSYERKWIFKTNLHDDEGTRILHINIENAKQCIEDGKVLKTEIVQTMYATHVSSSNDEQNMSQNFFRDNLMQNEITDSAETNMDGDEKSEDENEDENEDLRSQRSPTPHSQRSDA